MPSNSDIFDQQRDDWQHDPADRVRCVARAAGISGFIGRCLSRAMGTFSRMAEGQADDASSVATARDRAIRRATRHPPATARSLSAPYRAGAGSCAGDRDRHRRILRASSHRTDRGMARRPRKRADRFSHPWRARVVGGASFSPIGDLSTGQRWRERRDRALVGAFLGGGVKTGEAAALTVIATRRAALADRRCGEPAADPANAARAVRDRPCSTTGSASARRSGWPAT